MCALNRTGLQPPSATAPRFPVETGLAPSPGRGNLSTRQPNQHQSGLCIFSRDW